VTLSSAVALVVPLDCLYRTTRFNQRHARGCAGQWVALDLFNEIFDGTSQSNKALISLLLAGTELFDLGREILVAHA